MDFIAVIGMLSLAMDAFAVAVCKGLSLGKGFKLKHALKVGLYFGIFQAVMPLIGYFVGSMFSGYIEAVDHWIAFGLLAIIGGNMLKEAFSKDEDECMDCALDFKTMVLLAIATSIDALAAGVAFAMDDINIVIAVLIIGVSTFLLSFLGVKIGNVFGTKYKSKAEICGGVALILMGIKILVEGLGVQLPF